MSQREEQARATQFFEASKHPYETNQMRGMNQNLINKPYQQTNNFIDEMESHENFRNASNEQVYSELTGSYMDSNNFKHNNMVPFFKRRTQNTETFQNQAY